MLFTKVDKSFTVKTIKGEKHHGWYSGNGSERPRRHYRGTRSLLGVQNGEKRDSRLDKEETMNTGQNAIGLLLMLVIVVSGVFLADWLKARMQA